MPSFSDDLRTRAGNALRKVFATGVAPQRDIIVEEVRSQARHLATMLGTTAQRSADAEAARVEHLRAQVDALASELDEVRDVVRANRDDVPWHRRRLWDLRDSDAYAAVWDETEPLVSIRIATYNRAKIVRETALQSVLDQGYERYECIVVGDGCTDETGDLVAAIGDDRFSFVNLPHRSVYPEADEHRWYVAGAPPMNVGAHLARGTWIAPLDDDDAWTPDHIEVLLGTALQGRYELAYGRLCQQWADLPKRRTIGAYPPENGQFSFQGAMYLKLLDFFEYDTSSWVMREPGDWNLCRRMLEAGVRMGFTEKVVGTMYFRMKAHHFDQYGKALEAEFGSAALDAARRLAADGDPASS
ncbi:MAG: glycosyltransferase [Acidimicrobiia bacterium]|nr:glycosyltransferase [Acidimicrobiia bacterium]